MSDVAKWAMLVVGFVAIVGLILTMPFIYYIDADIFGEAITTVINIAGDSFVFARGLINNFFSLWARGAISGLILYWIGKFVMTTSIKILIWAYHFIFK